MADGALFSELMMENNERGKAFAENPEFQKLLVALYVMGNDDAYRLKCELEDLEVDNPLMSPDGKTITLGFTKIEKKKSGLLGPDGEELNALYPS